MLGAVKDLGLALIRNLSWNNDAINVADKILEELRSNVSLLILEGLKELLNLIIKVYYLALDCVIGPLC